MSPTPHRIVCTLATTVALLAVSATAALAADPVAQWKFDESGGQVVRDDGPFALDGELGSTSGVDAADPTRIKGVSGGALHFNSSLIRLPDAAETAPPTISVEAVVRADQSPGPYRYILSRGSFDCITGAYGLYTAADGGIAFYIDGGEAYHLTAAARPSDVWDGQWHHVAGVFDGKQLHLYVDGREVGSGIAGPAKVSYARTAPSLYFGDYPGTCRLPFTGDVDALRIWSGGLTASDVGELVKTSLGQAPTSTAPLPAAAAGSTLPLPDTGTAASASPPSKTVGAPARACQIKLTPAGSLTAGRKVTLKLKVTLRGIAIGGPFAKIQPVGSRKALAKGHLNKHGKLNLRFRPKTAAKLQLAMPDTPQCAAVTIKVKHAKKAHKR